MDEVIEEVVKLEDLKVNTEEQKEIRESIIKSFKEFNSAGITINTEEKTIELNFPIMGQEIRDEIYKIIGDFGSSGIKLLISESEKDKYEHIFNTEDENVKGVMLCDFKISNSFGMIDCIYDDSFIYSNLENGVSMLTLL